MFQESELESIWQKASKVKRKYPHTYVNLFGPDRLAVLHLLDEPVQSTLHQIIHQNVSPGTQCIYKGCTGTLDKLGRCSHDCCQLGINIVDDIIYCRNCDSYGFPCNSCHYSVFHQQLPMCLDKY